MKPKLSLLIFALFIASNCFAEGQDGLKAIILIVYAASILLYTVVGGLIIKTVLKLVMPNNPKSKWFPFILAFFIALAVALIAGDASIPFFWGEN